MGSRAISQVSPVILFFQLAQIPPEQSPSPSLIENNGKSERLDKLIQLLQAHITHLRTLWQHEYVSASVLRQQFIGFFITILIYFSIESQVELNNAVKNENAMIEELQEARATVEQLRESEKVLQKEVTRATSEIQVLKEQLESSQTSALQLEVECEGMKSQIQRLKFELETKSEKAKDLDLAQSQIENLKSQLDESKSELVKKYWTFNYVF